MKIKPATTLILIALTFCACKPKEATKPAQATDFISPKAFGIINFNLKSIDSTTGAKQFLHDKLGKNKEFKILNELQIPFSDFSNITTCLSQHEFYILTLKAPLELDRLFEKFLKAKSPKYNGERLLFEDKNVYRLTRKDESRFCAQVSPKIILIGQQNDLLNSLSSKAVSSNPIVDKIDFALPFSLLIKQSELLPPQLKDIKELSGQAQYKDTLDINFEGQFNNEQATSGAQNMLRTLIGFTPLPDQMRKSLKFEQNSTELKISAQVSDQEIAELLKEEMKKDK
ncbi:ribosomal biogenesis GTPase [Lentisphaera araneosa HTCC2155]|uniref:Ribosomal biogenesis GTPase n=1 Tax=Lentisphaera araneosa HTCC2155 TaxID=313628 RepID=A6DKV9_9BACT|nr:hypothetical protein [Lentisphaera araneosa]EDM27561.1 ribosomal biogenesis GTPase [Lentisphaera araneosa HTCC2155]